MRTALSYVTFLSILLGYSASANAATDKDLDAIEAVVRKMVAVVNGPAFARASREKRVEMLKQFYRPDASTRGGARPLYFGAFPEPAVGVDRYLDATALGFDWVFQDGRRWAMQVDDLQITAAGGLGVAVSTNTFTISNRQGKTLSANNGRATVVFENVNGRWLISHEHISSVNAQSPQWSEKKLEQELRKRQR